MKNTSIPEIPISPSQTFPFQAERFIEDCTALRQQSPLVHNITNFVAQNFSANVLLALGASPVMSHAVEEVQAMANQANALLLNIGTLDAMWVRSMLLAGDTMYRRRGAIVLDPVGAGATPYRTDTSWQLIRACHPTIIRGNASEIMALTNAAITTKGVDSTTSSAIALASAIDLARSTHSVVAISGATDYITDGQRIASVSNGSPLQTRVTAMGCSVSAVVAAFAAIQSDPFLASFHAMALMGIVGEMAAQQADGPGTLMIRFLDLLYASSPQQLSILYRP